MELRNLLNENDEASSFRAAQAAAAARAEVPSSANVQSAVAGMPGGYAIGAGASQNGGVVPGGASPGSMPSGIGTNVSQQMSGIVSTPNGPAAPGPFPMPGFMPQYPVSAYKNYGISPHAAAYPQHPGVDHMQRASVQDWRASASGVPNGSSMPPSYSGYQPAAQNMPPAKYNQPASYASPRGPSSGGASSSPVSAPPPLPPQAVAVSQPAIPLQAYLGEWYPLHGLAAAMRLIERFRKGEIQPDVQLREAGTAFGDDMLEMPVLLDYDIYAAKNTWNAVWKIDSIEKFFSELPLKEHRTNKEARRTLREYRAFAMIANGVSPEEEVWSTLPLPLMHQQSCVAKKNRHCMGCSNFWKSLQSIHDLLRPWGSNDMLRFEPDHTETLRGTLAMHASHFPLQIDPSGCTFVNTLYNADDANAVTLWGLIAPGDVHYLLEDDHVGFSLYEGRSFFDLQHLERVLKVTWVLQRPGQTVVIPPHWAFFNVQMGQGLAFSASWNVLPLPHLADARRTTELHRSLRLPTSVNISSLVVAAAYQKIDEYDAEESGAEKAVIADTLWKVEPVLKVIALEELLGEKVSISGTVVLAYNAVAEKLRHTGTRGLSGAETHELGQIRTLPLPAYHNDSSDDEEDVIHVCAQCKQRLAASRRSCVTCKGFDMCETCYVSFGKLHTHKMKRYRRIGVPTLLQLVDRISAALNEHVPANPGSAQKEKPKRKRDRREMRESDEPHTHGTHINGANDREEVIDCICGNNKDLGFMISCEKCLAWLHGKCVGISKRNEPSEYYCPRCVKTHFVGKLHPKPFTPEDRLREYKLI